MKTLSLLMILSSVLVASSAFAGEGTKSNCASAATAGTPDTQVTKGTDALAPDEKGTKSHGAKVGDDAKPSK